MLGMYKYKFIGAWTIETLHWTTENQYTLDRVHVTGFYRKNKFYYDQTTRRPKYIKESTINLILVIPFADL